jgi:DtxR family Mn-dependent transcriptional regulator
MYSLAEENYLKALYNLEDDDGNVSPTDLSKRLDIKLSSVNSMMKKLQEKGLVNYSSYKPLSLSEKGKEVASQIIRKHRLTEMFLVEKMGFGWEEVHEIAEQIEHINSPRFFEKMDELLNYPTHDPHGSPIPDREGKLEIINQKKLHEFKAGEVVHISAVASSNEDFLKLLNHKGISLGAVLLIKRTEPYDQSMTVLLEDKTEHMLSFQVTDGLYATTSKN